MPLWTPAGYSAWDTATDLGGVTPDVVAAGPTLGGLIGGVGVGFSAGSLAGMGVQSLLGKTGPAPEIGAGVGAAAGAASESIIPGMGTILGGLLGGSLGGAGGGIIGEPT